MPKPLHNQPLIVSPAEPDDADRIAFGQPGVAGGKNILWSRFKEILQEIGGLTPDEKKDLLELINARAYTKEPTGFTNNQDINVSYDSTARTVTLTGVFEAYYQGVLVSDLVSGWVSDPHPDVHDNYFLLYNGSTFEWATSNFNFSDLFICYAQYNTNSMALREVHGFMQHETHAELHETIGTYMSDGGDLSEYVLQSSTAADRRPDISSTTVNDEDLRTIINSLTTNLYTQRYLTGAAVRSLDPNQADIIALSGSRPYFNENVGGVWGQTLFPNNHYGAVFVVGIPVTSDTQSQQFRYMFVQPQQTSSDLATIEALTSNGLTHGDSSALVSEFVFFSKIIIEYTGGNWDFVSVEKITGTRINQVASAPGNYLSTVSSDDTINGDGTGSNPLSVTGKVYNVAKTFSTTEDREGLTANRTITWQNKDITPAGLDDINISKSRSNVTLETNGSSFIADTFKFAYEVQARLLANEITINCTVDNSKAYYETAILVRNDTTAGDLIVNITGIGNFEGGLFSGISVANGEKLRIKIGVFAFNSYAYIISEGGGGGSAYEYGTWRFQTSLLPPPGSGNFRLNNATLANVTELYLSDIDDSGKDVSLALNNLLGVGDKFLLKKFDDAAVYVTGQVTANTDESGYVTVGVSINAVSGSFSNNDKFVFAAKGESGGGATLSDINPIRFFCSDNDSDLTTDNRGFQYAQRNQTITSIFLAVETAPTGSGLILNVYKNGVSILTGNVTIAAGTNTLTVTTPTISDTAITTGDKMEVKVIAPGLTVAGAGLSAYFNTTLI